MPMLVKCAAAVLLLIAALVPLPYAGYMLIRVVAAVVLAWAAMVAVGKGQKVLAAACIVLALVLQPLIKLRLPRETWAAVDLAAAVLLLAAAFKLR